MISIILSISVSWAACGEASTVQQVSLAMDDASLAFATMDEDGFNGAAAKATESLGCLSVPLPTSKAAAYHRMEGLRMFLAGDPENAKLEFGAALRLEPDYALSAKIAPEGGKLYRLYEAGKEIPETSLASFRVPSGGRAWVDGTEGSKRPTDVPAIIQVGSDAKTIGWSSVLWPGSDVNVPASAVASAVADLDGGDDDDLDTKKPKKPKKDEFGDDVGGGDTASGDDDLDTKKPKKPKKDEFGDDTGDGGSTTPSGVTDLDDDSDDLDAKPKKPKKNDFDDDGGSSASDDDDVDDLRPTKKPKSEGEAKPFNKMWIGVGASAAVAGGLFGVSAAMNSAFDKNPTKGTYDANHATYYGSLGMAGVTVVLAGIAIGGSL